MRSLSVNLLNGFLETLTPMHSKLGPIMFQFEYLNKQKMPSMTTFLERLHALFADAPAGFQYAIEIRNPNYLKDEFTDALHGLGPARIMSFPKCRSGSGSCRSRLPWGYRLAYDSS